MLQLIHFKNGKKHGQGTYLYSKGNKDKGDIFVGEYVNGKRDGIGTYFYKNGNRYIGQYKLGKRDGEGFADSPPIRIEKPPYL